MKKRVRTSTYRTFLLSPYASSASCIGRKRIRNRNRKCNQKMRTSKLVFHIFFKCFCCLGDDDEDDPLDAYMKNLENQAKTKGIYAVKVRYPRTHLNINAPYAGMWWLIVGLQVPVAYLGTYEPISSCR